MTDINLPMTNNKKIEEFRKKIESSDEFFAAIVDNANVIVVCLDCEGTILLANKFTEFTTKYSKEEIIGKNWFDILCPKEKFPDVWNDYLKLKEGGFAKDRINSFITKDGQERTILWRNNEFYENGVITGLISVGVDITRQVNFENAFIESENKSRLLTEVSPVCIFQMSDDGKILYMNSAWTKMTGSATEEALDDKWTKFLHPLDRQKALEDLQSIRLKEMPTDREYRFLHKETKSIIWVLSRIVPHKSPDNKLTGYIGTFTDISTQKEVEEALVTAKLKAEETDKLKTSLLANMSHELRTPMTGILGFAKILTEELLDPEYIELAGRILKSGKRLMSTLNSILDLAEMESNKLKINKENICLSDAVKLFCQQYQIDAEEKHLFFDVIIHDDQVYVENDMRMLQTVVSNLLDNAVKYTYTGGIIVEVDHMEFQGREWAVVKIKDTGIGIEEDKRNIVFEEFRQASEGIGREYEGTGLGLALVKKFAALMGGTVLLKSETGLGSTFTLCLPLNVKNVSDFPANQSSVSFDTSTIASGLSDILLVEDNDMNVMVTELFLKKLYNIDHVKSGAGALKKAAEKKYSLILMDINLGGGMNGIETAKKIKLLPGYEKINIVAVTGYAMAGDREHFLEEGFFDYIAKPFDKKDLLNTIKKSIGQDSEVMPQSVAKKGKSFL